MVRVAWTKALATIQRLKTGMVQGLGLQIWGLKEQKALIMLRIHSIVDWSPDSRPFLRKRP